MRWEREGIGEESKRKRGQRSEDEMGKEGSRGRGSEVSERTKK